MRNIDMEQAIRVGTLLSDVFKEPPYNATMMNHNFYNKYQLDLGRTACTLLAAWGTKYESRFSDVAHTMESVTNEFVTLVTPWWQDIICVVFPTSNAKRAQSRDNQLINKRKLHACALSLDFARDLLCDNLGFAALVKEYVAKRNWLKRPQGKLLAALSAQLLEFAAIWLHATSSIEQFAKQSPYWSMLNVDARIVVVHDAIGSVASTGWIAEYPYAVERYRTDIQTKMHNLAESLNV
jgi:hypothetical protein